MLQVKYIAQVDETKCNGCKLCTRVCLTETITMAGPLPVVDRECVGCTRCLDICWHADAITMVPHPEPRLLRVEPAEVDEALVRDLCAKAHRLPGELVCICASTFAGEIAAAIVKGARSFKEISLMTGVLAGCQEFCVPVIQRMLKAVGVDVTRAGGFIKYDQTLTMWDLPQELREKYPGYWLEEDIELGRRS